MPIDPQVLRQWPFEELEQTYTARDTMLYALGLGCAADPMDADDLKYVYEAQLEALPSMAVVLADPGFWLTDPRAGIDWKKVLHGEQTLRIFGGVPAAGTLIGRGRVTGLFDRGKEKGAVLVWERDVFDKASGELLWRTSSTAILRGDGGFGGPSGPLPVPHPIPDRVPDQSLSLPTLPQAAFIYRLSGDYNALHVDPAVARAAGFSRPIFQGLGTFGIACRALVRMVCGNNPVKLRAVQVRFSSPVYPGETVVTEVWREADGILSFRAKVAERDVVVINNGRAEIAA